MKEISVVIPVYNSGDNLTELHRQLKEALQGLNHEIIFVNDCSPDNSWKILKQIAQTDENVISINLRKNFGQDSALMAGLKNSSGKFVVIMDDDLQHSPFDIIRLYNRCKEGYDVCYAKFSGKDQAGWKNIGSWLNGIFAKYLFQKPDGVYMSPFKIIRGEVVKEILNYKGPFPYIDGLLLQLTQNVISEETIHYKRFRGKSNFNFIRSFTVFMRTLTSFSTLPLRFATLVGFFFSFLGFCAAIYYLLEYFFINKTIEGWTSLIISLLVIGGLILISLGLIGEYLGRMFLTLNDKPQYSITEIVKTDNEK